MNKVLVVYHQIKPKDRKTVSDHLFAFARHSLCEVWHYNTAGPLPFFLNSGKFDLIIFHYTFLATRWNGRSAFRQITKKLARLETASALKIAFPQDEYLNSYLLCEFFSKFAVDHVFTCFTARDWDKAYPPERRGRAKLHHTLTGYVEQREAQTILPRLQKHSQRSVDVGYRARKLPFWNGRMGIQKWRITEEFSQAKKSSSLRTNVSNRCEDVFLADEWLNFLAECRVVLGCESGSNLLDTEGKIRTCVDTHTEKNPKISYDEVEQSCFPGQDGAIQLATVSPRHFEAAMTKTCQALIEGEYEGILRPGVHYIPIRSDFSNWPEVLEKIQDHKLCEAMAEKTYADLVASQRYSYEAFVQDVFCKIGFDPTLPSKSPSSAKSFVEILVRALLTTSNFSAIYYASLRHDLKSLVFQTLRKLNLVGVYRICRKRLLSWEE